MEKKYQTYIKEITKRKQGNWSSFKLLFESFTLKNCLFCLFFLFVFLKTNKSSKRPEKDSFLLECWGAIKANDFSGGFGKATILVKKWINVKTLL